jgi:hypothetical protein
MKYNQNKKKVKNHWSLVYSIWFRFDLAFFSDPHPWSSYASLQYNFLAAASINFSGLITLILHLLCTFLPKVDLRWWIWFWIKFLLNFSYNFWSGLKVYLRCYFVLIYRMWDEDNKKFMLIDKPGMNDKSWIFSILLH